jgi:hypothetical protein
MRNIADVTGSKPIAVWSQSISGVSGKVHHQPINVPMAGAYTYVMTNLYKREQAITHREGPVRIYE